MNSKTFFCNQIAVWLSAQEWHFTTLISTLIETVDNLPADADQLVSELLNALTDHRSTDDISKFLQSSHRVKRWFASGLDTPTITQLSLQPPGLNRLSDSRLPPLNSVGDLAAWLDTTSEQLDWLADQQRYDVGSPDKLRHYHYSIVKKRDGRKRLIESPKSQLKAVQRKILVEILQTADVHHCAHGFIKGRNCKSHASQHVGKHYLLLFDLAHCFHSIRWHPVLRVFTQLGYTAKVAQYLTALVTHKAYSHHALLSELDSDQRYRVLQRHAPQGAPSSPCLSNVVLNHLDKRLYGLAKSLELDYSRYADDLAFSGNTHRNWQFLEPLVGSICNEEGFSLNYRKTRQLRLSQRQLITGIVVNEKPNIDRRYYERLKAVLTNCKNYGLNSQNRADHSDFRAHLLGCIQHVKSLNETKGTRLENIYKQISD